MADPAEVKVGSELVFRGRVESVQPNGVLVRFATALASSPGRTFMSKSEVERAEVGMADLRRVKVGDKLRVEVEVTRAVKDGDGQYMRAKFARAPGQLDYPEFGVPDSVVAGAEHIPAPPTFRRGDWVRHVDDYCRSWGRGIVLAVRDGGATVHFDGTRDHGVPVDVRYNVPLNRLEPVRAPE